MEPCFYPSRNDEVLLNVYATSTLIICLLYSLRGHSHLEFVVGCHLRFFGSAPASDLRRVWLAHLQMMITLYF